MQIQFIKGKYGKIILYRKGKDTIELWMRFKNMKNRERFDQFIIDEYLDKWWYISETKRDSGLSLYLVLKKIKIKSLFI